MPVERVRHGRHMSRVRKSYRSFWMRVEARGATWRHMVRVAEPRSSEWECVNGWKRLKMHRCTGSADQASQPKFQPTQPDKTTWRIIEPIQQAQPYRLAHQVRLDSLAQLSKSVKIGYTRRNPSTQLSRTGQSSQPIRGPNLVNLIQPGSSPNSFPFLFLKHKLTLWV
jgi:hypothetical protein